MTTRDDIFKYVKRKYGANPEYLWAKSPNFAVLRHADNRRWFALIMDVPQHIMNMPDDGTIDIMNVKCDAVLRGMLMGTPGYRPAYHMNKEHWITVLLDGSVNRDEIFNLINYSADLTATKRKNGAK